MKAVVTGAGAGLGASIAKRLASEGYAVALLDQDGDAASGCAEKLIGASAFQVDVSSPCLLYTSPSPRDRTRSRMPSSA